MNRSDSDLDGLLAQMRGDDPDPSAALMARVLADAAAVQPRAGAAVSWITAPALPMVVPSFWSQLAGVFGGGGALAGMSLATVAGVFLGIVQPAPVAALTQAFASVTPLEQMDLLPGEDTLWVEE